MRARSNGDRHWPALLLRLRQWLNVHEALIITGFHPYLYGIVFNGTIINFFEYVT